MTRNIGEVLCLKYQSDLEKALGYALIRGPQIAFENFTLAVKEDILASKGLREAFEANPMSGLQALVMAAQCKLLPGSRYGKFYLTTRKVKGVPTVVPIIGYKGLAEMANRHERVHTIEAFCVYEGEDFEMDVGQSMVRHKFRPGVDNSDSKMIAVYGKAILTERDSAHPVLDRPVLWPLQMRDVLASRARSDAYRYAEGNGKKDSPWHMYFATMARKTAMRQLLTRGSVPQDMGLGGILQEEELSDTSNVSDIEDPKQEGQEMTRSDQARIMAGLPPKNLELPQKAQDPEIVMTEAMEAEYRQIMGEDG